MTALLTSNFSACALGPFTNAQKILAFGSAPGSDSDKTGIKYTIVNDPDLPAYQGGGSGFCMECFYPKDTVGEVGQQFQYKIASAPQSTAITLDFDIKIMPGFDMSAGGGKLGARVCWGLYAGNTGGPMAMYWWDNPGEAIHPALVCVLQDQGFNPGGEYLRTSTPGVIAPQPFPNANSVLTNGTPWFHCYVELLGGPNGYAKYSVPAYGISFASPKGQYGNSSLTTSDIWADFGYLYGGGPGSAPSSNGLVRIANVKYATLGSGTTPVVQTGEFHGLGNASTTTVIDTHADIPADSTIFVAGMMTAGSLSSVTDSAGNTYTVDRAGSGGDGAVNLGTPTAFFSTDASSQTSLAAHPGTNTTATSSPANAFIYIVASSAAASSGLSGVTDTQGNTYTVVGDSSAGGVSYAYCFNAKALASTDTVTGTFSGSASSHSLIGIYVTGVGAGAIDKNPATTSGTGTSATSIASGVLAQASEILFGNLEANGGIGTLTPGTGWTGDIGASGSLGAGLDISWAEPNATTSLSWAPSWVNSHTWLSRLLSFKAAGWDVGYAHCSQAVAVPQGGTITLTFSQSGNWPAVAGYASGFNGGHDADATPSLLVNATSGSVSVTPTANSDLVVGVIAFAGNPGTVTPGGSFSLAGTAGATSELALCSVTAPANTNPVSFAPSWVTANGAKIFAVAYKPASASTNVVGSIVAQAVGGGTFPTIAAGNTVNVKINPYVGLNGTGAAVTVANQMSFTCSDSDVTFGAAINLQEIPVTISATAATAQNVQINVSMPGLNPTTGHFLINIAGVTEAGTIP